MSFHVHQVHVHQVVVGDHLGGDELQLEKLVDTVGPLKEKTPAADEHGKQAVAKVAELEKKMLVRQMDTMFEMRNEVSRQLEVARRNMEEQLARQNEQHQENMKAMLSAMSQQIANMQAKNEGPLVDSVSSYKPPPAYITPQPEVHDEE